MSVKYYLLDLLKKRQDRLDTKWVKGVNDPKDAESILYESEKLEEATDWVNSLSDTPIQIEHDEEEEENSSSEELFFHSKRKINDDVAKAIELPLPAFVNFRHFFTKTEFGRKVLRKIYDVVDQLNLICPSVEQLLFMDQNISYPTSFVNATCFLCNTHGRFDYYLNHNPIGFCCERIETGIQNIKQTIKYGTTQQSVLKMVKHLDTIVSKRTKN